MRIPGKKNGTDSFRKFLGLERPRSARSGRGVPWFWARKLKDIPSFWPQKWKDIPSFWPPKLKGYSLLFGEPNRSQKWKAIPSFPPQKLKDFPPQKLKEIPWFWPQKLKDVPCFWRAKRAPEIKGYSHFFSPKNPRIFPNFWSQNKGHSQCLEQMRSQFPADFWDFYGFALSADFFGRIFVAFFFFFFKLKKKN